MRPVRALAVSSSAYAPAAAACALAAFTVVACGGDPEPTDPPFVPQATITAVGADPLAGTTTESCPTYLDERCVAGARQRCEIVDAATQTKVASPDPLLRRVFLYDRWYDRHLSPTGLTAERVFTGTVTGAMTEAEWSAPANFAGWAGQGDAGIWTGAALMADIFRYAVTRTEADYRRMEEKTRTLIRSFEVTGVPGYLARYHFLQLPAGGPRSDRLPLKYGTEADLGKVDIELPSLDVEGLPIEYTQGVPDGQGGFVRGKAYWNGDTSIDQYTGPMTAFPIVWSLLKDQVLKDKIAYHMTCYLKRLVRVEIINLSRKPELVQEVLTAFGGTSIKLDADDPDIRELDKLVWYVHPGLNRRNVGSFDKTCPDSVQLTSTRILDATSESFFLDLLDLNVSIDRGNRTQPVQYDHFYIPSLRGGDASHLIHLAAMAYYFTGEEQYRSFLFDELIGNLRADDVARTMMAFRLPDWCFKFYGDHITYGTHWQLITLLSDGPLKDGMIRVMEEEAWQKAMHNHKSAKFNVMYLSSVPDDVATSKARAINEAVTQLQGFGGNDGVLDAPRRTYTRSRQSIIDAFPAGTTVRCPSEAERTACEMGGTLLGFPLESAVISRACDGRAGECVMADGKCTDGIASEGLPPALRKYSDFMWQRSPFDIGENVGIEGQLQSPGRDLSEPYWMARHYGYITGGEGQVLAWSDAAQSCAE